MRCGYAGGIELATHGMAAQPGSWELDPETFSYEAYHCVGKQ